MPELGKGSQGPPHHLPELSLWDEVDTPELGAMLRDSAVAEALADGCLLNSIRTLENGT